MYLISAVWREKLCLHGDGLADKADVSLLEADTDVAKTLAA
jgi:hypothetical protein